MIHARPRHDHIHVYVGGAILGVLQIDHRHAADNTDADRGHSVVQGQGLDDASIHRLLQSKVEREVSTADRCAAGSPSASITSQSM